MIELNTRYGFWRDFGTDPQAISTLYEQRKQFGEATVRLGKFGHEVHLRCAIAGVFQTREEAKHCAEKLCGITIVGPDAKFGEPLSGVLRWVEEDGALKLKCGIYELATVCWDSNCPREYTAIMPRGRDYCPTLEMAMKAIEARLEVNRGN